jgi:outer membrane protein TolC
MDDAERVLREALDAALRNSTVVRQAEAAYLAASGSVRREAGAFDPELFLHVDHLDEEQPSSSFFAGAPTLSTIETDYRTGLRLKLPIGTSLEVGMNASRLRPTRPSLS